MKNTKEYFLTDHKLPLVIESTDSSVTFEGLLKQIEENREELHKKILQYGGILFRGYPVSGSEQFNQVVAALGLGETVSYIGGDSPRTKVKGRVYTSTEAPPSIKILLHNEMSFIKNYPHHIYFHCEVEPVHGGATILADARKVYADVDPSVRNRFIENGFKYISRYYHKSKVMDFINNNIQKGHKNWMDVMETEDKAVVEKRCKEQDFDFKWLKNDWLELNQVRPAVMTHPKTKEDVWFNQIHLYDYNPKFLGWPRYLGVKLFYSIPDTLVHEVRYANGKKIAREDIYHVMDVLDRNTISYPWKKGDVIALDNVLAMHGRAPFKGKRRILTALTSATK